MSKMREGIFNELVAISANVLRLGEVAEYGKINYQF